MPQTTPERAARWPHGEQQAMACLRGRGFVLGCDWCWRHPERTELDDLEADAVLYLIEEWDFGPFITDEKAVGR